MSITELATSGQLFNAEQRIKKKVEDEATYIHQHLENQTSSINSSIITAANVVNNTALDTQKKVDNMENYMRGYIDPQLKDIDRGVEAVERGIDNLGQNINNLEQGISETVINAYAGIQGGIGDAFKDASATIGAFMEGTSEEIAEQIINLRKSLGMEVEGMSNKIIKYSAKIETGINTGFSLIDDALNGLGSLIAGAVDGVVSAVGGFIESGWMFITGFIDDRLSEFQAWIGELFDFSPEKLVPALQGIIDAQNIIASRLKQGG